MQGVTIALGITGVVGFLLIYLFRDNRLLFWCVTIALSAHLSFAAGMWAIAHFWREKESERQIAVTIQAPEVKKVEPPKIEEQPEHKFDLPLGRPDGDRDEKKIKKGTTLDPNAREGAKGEKIFGNQRTMASPTAGPGDVGYDPEAKGYDLYGPGDSLDPKDLYKIGQAGGGGEDWGVPDGDPDGGVPAGFEQGKKDGRVYFVRLKYGASSAWFFGNDGTQRLLAYLNRTFPCQSDTWPMSTTELRKKYLNKGKQPSFIYAYCDEGFSLSSEDVLVLREYIDKGGFLFLDSRSDPLTKETIARELDKVLPGAKLAPIPGNHLIYRFLYILNPVPAGLNLSDRRNYGITRNGRLVVFYCMGDLAFLYHMATPDDDQRWAAQYQLGANVMLYGITKGNPAGFTQQQGARVEITTQMLEKIGFLSSEPSSTPRALGESVKVKPPNTTGSDGKTEEPLPDDPDEINILD